MCCGLLVPHYQEPEKGTSVRTGPEAEPVRGIDPIAKLTGLICAYRGARRASARTVPPDAGSATS